MPETIQKPQQLRKLTDREQLTIDYLPECKWVLFDAAVKANFSPKYAKHRLPGRMLADVALRTAKEAKLAECKAKAKADREERQQFWSDIMRDKAVDIDSRLRASEDMGKSEADFTENINTTDLTKQAELAKVAEAEEIELRRIANIRLMETIAEPKEETKAG